MKSLIVLAILSFSINSHAFPQAPFDALKTTINHDEKLLKDNYDFEGIIKLNNCSASLIKFIGQPMTSKAVVLTNGHCLSSSVTGQMLKHNEVLYNKPSSRDMRIISKAMKKFSVKATKLLYATITNTDIAFYELSESYETILLKYNIEAFTLDSVRPFEGVNIDIISGYWKTIYSCAIDSFVFNLKEGDWMFTDSIRFTDGCETKGGTSGSPIVSRGTRSVIAVNNTINENGPACALNNPCEISEDGKIQSLKSKKYGQQTYIVYSCLRPDFNIDLDLEGCLLPKP